jgi:hypothetical protein
MTAPTASARMWRPIGARLKARPVTTLCIGASRAKAEERRQKHRFVTSGNGRENFHPEAG